MGLIGSVERKGEPKLLQLLIIYNFSTSTSVGSLKSLQNGYTNTRATSQYGDQAGELVILEQANFSTISPRLVLSTAASRTSPGNLSIEFALFTTRTQLDNSSNRSSMG
jgi:hypothetical protein